jgi:hypothetical protein
VWGECTWVDWILAASAWDIWLLPLPDIFGKILFS